MLCQGVRQLMRLGQLNATWSQVQPGARLFPCWQNHPGITGGQLNGTGLITVHGAESVASQFGGACRRLAVVQSVATRPRDGGRATVVGFLAAPVVFAACLGRQDEAVTLGPKHAKIEVQSEAERRGSTFRFDKWLTRPVLNPKPRYQAEVPQVPCHQRGLSSQGNAGDQQVRTADLPQGLHLAQAIEFPRSRGVDRKHHEAREQFLAADQPLLGEVEFFARQKLSMVSPELGTIGPTIEDYTKALELERRASGEITRHPFGEFNFPRQPFVNRAYKLPGTDVL